MLKGVERVQLQLEGLTTHFGDEREPYGSRQLAPVGPRACSLHGQIEVLEMAEQEGVVLQESRQAAKRDFADATSFSQG